MLSVLGRGSRLCDGRTRREILRIGGLSLFGSLSVPGLLRATGLGRSLPLAVERG